MDIQRYYGRRDVRQRILESAKGKEVAVRYGETFGKRPDILQFENDILELANQGATSFHISEENWFNPLHLSPGMLKIQLDSLRESWDLILDVDSEHLEYSRKATHLLLEALKLFDVDEFSLKFSGNRGFHIALHHTLFPEKVNNQLTKNLFPEGPRIISEYLKSVIHDHLREELSKETEKNKITNPFSFVTIDTILISSRHLFRSPYSINEKSGLVSIPIQPKSLLHFKTQQAEKERVDASLSFLEEPKEKGQATPLLIKAFDWSAKNKEKEKLGNKEYTKKYSEITTKISEDIFPPCIKTLLNSRLEDGRKRTVFVLINFLRSLNWSLEDIEKRILEWNSYNTKPLPAQYIKVQINWNKKQKERFLPPSCDKREYYLAIPYCFPEDCCAKIKNPVNYTLRLLKNKPKEKKQKKRTKKQL